MSLLKKAKTNKLIVKWGKNKAKEIDKYILSNYLTPKPITLDKIDNISLLPNNINTLLANTHLAFILVKPILSRWIVDTNNTTIDLNNYT